jgi:hypothetical protein
MDDYPFIVHLCDSCVHAEYCEGERQSFPIRECGAYECDEPDIDGDAYWEYMNASLYGREVIGHEDSCGIRE